MEMEMTKQGVPSGNNKEKTENVLIAIGIMVGALLMAVISWFILPDYVSTQPAGFTTGAPAFPKWVAVLFPFVLTGFFAVSSINSRKQFFACLIGYALYVVFWLIN